ncbi:site-specific recombinase XerD [Bellilinea caldifistulae]|uniref:Core-binding (CB) domain-containing protein n=1 Tax=Bellilinea caldifistulae TaxID=360411 RepID=A0A0P6XCU0_9CHLR|nr:phage integrase N-terminal SAM-like domain-containing protein [Bellilinea caldifistulae]KPL77575.1 hypothetical protein AC812_03300 [Bellilinea caldifistulae]GAP09636.1 site-specific recombinase XerD [Bellilinea caldifistulae]
MSPQNTICIKDALEEFLLSRQAMRCSSKTLRTYQSILGRFTQWLEKEGVQTANQMTSRHVRRFMSQISGTQWL